MGACNQGKKFLDFDSMQSGALRPLGDFLETAKMENFNFSFLPLSGF